HGIKLRLAAAVLTVLRVVEVAAHAAARHREAVRGSPVEVRVERDGEDFGVAVTVAARDRRANRRRVGSAEASADVERIVVVDQPHLSGDAWLSAFIRNLLYE